MPASNQQHRACWLGNCAKRLTARAAGYVAESTSPFRVIRITDRTRIRDFGACCQRSTVAPQHVVGRIDSSIAVVVARYGNRCPPDANVVDVYREWMLGLAAGLIDVQLEAAYVEFCGAVAEDLVERFACAEWTSRRSQINPNIAVRSWCLAVYGFLVCELRLQAEGRRRLRVAKDGDPDHRKSLRGWNGKGFRNGHIEEDVVHARWIPQNHRVKRLGECAVERAALS